MATIMIIITIINMMISTTKNIHQSKKTKKLVKINNVLYYDIIYYKLL